jgi:hypothetical protein
VDNYDQAIEGSLYLGEERCALCNERWLDSDIKLRTGRGLLAGKFACRKCAGDKQRQRGLLGMGNGFDPGERVAVLDALTPIEQTMVAIVSCQVQNAVHACICVCFRCYFFARAHICSSIVPDFFCASLSISHSTAITAHVVNYRCRIFTFNQESELD